MKDNLALFSGMRSTSSLAVAALVVLGCGGSPVTWNADTSVRVASNVVLTPTGDTTAAPAENAEQFVAACPGSARFAHAGAMHVAVWWSARPDSGARLMAARSLDSGRTWSAPAPVDTLDRSVSACHRPPAAVAVDSASGYVHVSYGMVAPEGAGIFFAHSMDSGATFHAPVPIVYGDRLGSTSVAASGDVVAVAFEDPNGTTARVGLALSHTMGHIFEDRLMPVSDDNGVATQPQVAVAGRQIAIGWREGAATRGDTVLRIRTGLLH